jgi:hypothetical protein
MILGECFRILPFKLQIAEARDNPLQFQAKSFMHEGEASQALLQNLQTWLGVSNMNSGGGIVQIIVNSSGCGWSAPTSKGFENPTLSSFGTSRVAVVGLG